MVSIVDRSLFWEIFSTFPHEYSEFPEKGYGDP